MKGDGDTTADCRGADEPRTLRWIQPDTANATGCFRSPQDQPGDGETRSRSERPTSTSLRRSKPSDPFTVGSCPGSVKRLHAARLAQSAGPAKPIQVTWMPGRPRLSAAAEADHPTSRPARECDATALHLEESANRLAHFPARHSASASRRANSDPEAATAAVDSYQKAASADYLLH